MPVKRFSILMSVALTLLVGPTPAVGAEDRVTEAERVESARIVSMVPSITETLFALGVGERVVGVSEYCDFPPPAAALPRVGTFVAPVAEAIVALRPDLVLTSPSPGNESAVRALERVGVRVAVVGGDASLAEVRAAIRRIADVVGVPERGRELVRSMDDRIDAVRAAWADRPPVRVAVVVGHEPLILAGPASYLGELVAIAGGRNVAEAVGGRWPRVGMEAFVAQQPEVIIDVSMGGTVPPDPEVLRSRWESLSVVPAVGSGRLYGHRSFLLLRPGPRLGIAAESVAEMIHGPPPAPEAGR